MKWTLILLFLFLFLLIALTQCAPLSESVMQPNAGFNGSFEIVSKQLPVNWRVYSPSTLHHSAFEFEVDSGFASEGKRAAHFKIYACDTTGGNLSPGLATEIHVQQNSLYRVSFDLQNRGGICRFVGGPVSLKQGQNERLMEERDSTYVWTSYAYEIFVPANDSLLFLQWNWIAPGEGWLDNVRVEKK